MTREECEIGIQDASLPPKTRSLYCGIMATLFVDSITKDESPAKMIYVFDEVLSSQGRAFSKSTATKGQVEPTTNLEVSTAYLSTENVNKAHPEFEKTKDWIRHFLDANRSQTENNELNELVSCTLELLFAMVRLGFYDSNSQLEQLLPVLLDVLDGRNDGLSGGDKTDVLDAEETDRFIKNEMTEVLITTKVQICNIIDKIMDNRLRLRMSKIVSCWKTEQ